MHLLFTFFTWIPISCTRGVEEAKSSGCWCKRTWYRHCTCSSQKDARWEYVFIRFCWYSWWLCNSESWWNHKATEQACTNCMWKVTPQSSLSLIHTPHITDLFSNIVLVVPASDFFLLQCQITSKYSYWGLPADGPCKWFYSSVKY